MPDRHASPPRDRAPQDWSAAFAQLPSDTPPSDGWARIAARLADGDVGSAVPADAPANGPDHSVAVPATTFIAATRRRSASPRRWAIAAMLAAALPLAWWLSQQGITSPGANPSRNGQIAGSERPRDRLTPAPVTPVTQSDPRLTGLGQTHLGQTGPDQIAATQIDPTLADPTRTDPDRTDPGLIATQATPHPDRPGSRPDERALATATDPSPRSPRATTQTATPRRDSAPDSASEPASTRLATRATDSSAQSLAQAGGNADSDAIVRSIGELQAQSAQLEALIAATRDDRVASASAAVMSSDLDQRLGLIDATLISASLPATQRLSLWQQRVGTLRALAGVESTQRWFAAQGERYDDALVRVD